LKGALAEFGDAFMSKTTTVKKVTQNNKVSNKFFLLKKLKKECLARKNSKGNYNDAELKDIMTVLFTEHNVPQKDLCSLSKISRSTVSRWISTTENTNPIDRLTFTLKEDDSHDGNGNPTEDGNEIPTPKSDGNGNPTENGNGNPNSHCIGNVDKNGNTNGIEIPTAPETPSITWDRSGIENPISHCTGNVDGNSAKEEDKNGNEIPILECAGNVDPTENGNGNPSGNTQKIPSILFFFAGILSFAYLFNAEFNFYLTQDIENLSLINVANENYWLSVLKALIVLSGIVVSTLLNKKILLYALSAYTLVASVVVSHNNYINKKIVYINDKLDKEKIDKKKEEEELNKKIEQALQHLQKINKPLFDKKKYLEERKVSLDDQLTTEIKAKERHLSNKAYGHLEKTEKNIIFLQKLLSNIDKKYNETIDKIETKTEEVVSGVKIVQKEKKVASKTKEPSFLYAFLVSISMKLFALIIKIISFEAYFKKQGRSHVLLYLRKYLRN
jgi:hypothetical protein